MVSISGPKITAVPDKECLARSTFSDVIIVHMLLLNGAYLFQMYDSLLLEAIKLKGERVGQVRPQALKFSIHIADRTAHCPLCLGARCWHQSRCCIAP